MRKVLSVFASVAMIGATALAFSAGPVAGDDGVGLADPSVTVTDSPDAVSPVGGIVVYTVTASNRGPLPVDVVLDDSTTNGSYVKDLSVLPDECTKPADGASNPEVSCSFEAMAPGAEKVLEIAIETPFATGVTSNTATVEIDPEQIGEILDSDTANNSDTELTPVNNDPNNSATLLQKDDSLSFKTHTLTVRSGTVIVTLKDAPAVGAMCGTSPCATGLHIGFDERARFQGVVGIDVNFGKGQPCRGTGNPSCNDGLWVRKNGTVTKVPMCAAGSASPCIESEFKAHGDWHSIVRMNSTDPDLLPPLVL